MADKAKSKSLAIEPIKYPGSVADFRAWMDGFLVRAGVGLLQSSFSWDEIKKRAAADQKGGDIIDFTRYSPRLVVRYSEIDRSPAREVWYVNRFDPMTDDKFKFPKRWATILAIETFGNTTVEFLDGVYFRYRDPNGGVTDNARAEFIGEEFSSYAKLIKDEWQKNFQHEAMASNNQAGIVGKLKRKTESQVYAQTGINRKLRVFLCHASQDKPIVRELYQRLLAEGWIDPWLDKEKLLPGQDWDMEIEKAVEDSDAVIVCLSKNSVTKEGYIQKEMKKVFDKTLEKPEGVIFVIPLRFDNCNPPRQLQKYQYLDYFPKSKRDAAYDVILKSLKARAISLGFDIDFDEYEDIHSAIVSLMSAKDTEIAPAPLRVTSTKRRIHHAAGFELVEIPSGIFLMGSSDRDTHAKIDEKPQHEMDIFYDYWIGRFPITNKLFKIYADYSKRSFDFALGKDELPVSNISRYEASEYIHWLNKNYISDLPSGYIFQLPSEAEWEKAARGTDGRIYPWGDEFEKDYCNTKEGGIGSTTRVGNFSPSGDSPYGLADVVGNVMEWTRSVYKGYPYLSNDGRETDAAAEINLLVARGGSWNSDCIEARVANRHYFRPDPWGKCGIRVAVVPKL